MKTFLKYSVVFLVGMGLGLLLTPPILAFLHGPPSPMPQWNE